MCKYNELDFLLNQSLQICAANERNKLNKNKKSKSTIITKLHAFWLALSVHRTAVEPLHAIDPWPFLAGNSFHLNWFSHHHLSKLTQDPAQLFHCGHGQIRARNILISRQRTDSFPPTVAALQPWYVLAYILALISPSVHPNSIDHWHPNQNLFVCHRNNVRLQLQMQIRLSNRSR